MTRKGLMVTHRDKEIFKTIFRQRTVTEKQIHQKCFASTSKQITNRRLLNLVQSGYLIKNATYKNKRMCSHFLLQEKAFNKIKNEIGYETKKPSLKCPSVNHDLFLVDINLRLEKCKMTLELFTENILQTTDCVEVEKLNTAFVALNTDLLAHIRTKNSDYWIPIEWEMSNKGITRYLDKLLSYYLEDEIKAIFYICDNEEIERAIRKADKEVCKDFESKLYTCLLRNVLNEKSIIAFQNKEYEDFSLN